MPELPEAEVVRRGLDRWVSGRRVETVDIVDARSVRRQEGGPAAFESALLGARFAAAARRGKFLWLPFVRDAAAEPRDAVVTHLGMSGQVLLQDPAMPDPRHLKIRLTLDGGPARHEGTSDLPGELRFVDQRIFGGMFVSPLVPTLDGAPGGAGTDLPLIPAAAGHIARDVLDPLWDPSTFHRALTRLPSGRPRTTGVKRVILDQAVISGVGNIYADEALWYASLHYDRPASTLTRTHSGILLEALIDVMRRSLEEGGTSFDSLYVNVNGESGYFARSLQAYGREGRDCLRCGGRIVREPFMGRSSYRCPRCQRRPRLKKFTAADARV
ncbi:bifunctional DNA-formamidopyrimidine glycosylase/DNA-(apurinic or apyrimidinic site) lyase [Zhihengliuella sp.]|uniref:bifunctional DNA-formamidopyrimidine glycosylase/DNA-(apurinic or apyrimidinic site) lyase n=1 Tax=Zhihengliuella sp. TaxID=1954483 RepID=UPI0028110501|nr:bifunctional DNA-formamidopyrimidine glycosylase/DNA-(apurinic or apyrimidinic site) lyase [Zhihengliuella sp.]